MRRRAAGCRLSAIGYQPESESDAFLFASLFLADS
jgi:hypothetical protein